MERADNPWGHSGAAPPNTLTVQTGTFVQHAEDWTVGYGAARFRLRNVLGLTYIQRLLQHPGEQFHALDLLSGAAPSEMLESDVFARFRDENVVVGRPGDIGPILDEHAKRDYRRRISELNAELSELRERGNLSVLGENDYRRRAEIETELEALSRQLAQAVGIFSRVRRSGSDAERARLNVTRAIRSAIERISERSTTLGVLLGSCIKTGSFCSYIPNARSPIEWEFTIEGVTLEPMAAVPASASQPSEAQFVQPVRSTTAFVGREKERELLRRCMQEVERGQGQIVVIAGPPGIGKTRTAREVGNEARQRGFIALAGNCYDREDSVPFVPFVELLEVVLARAPGPAAIREIFGDQAAELSRLLPQLRRLFSDLPAQMQVSAEQSRRMLFNAIVDLVGQQSALSPLLLLLEDLHWADEGTLALLTHLARSISTMAVLIIATHRNDDIDMKPPLSKTLGELSRLGIVEQLPLVGLPEPAVARMIELLSGQEPSPALVDLIYSNTDGNPLFVEELIRDLEQKEANGDQTNGDPVERLKHGEVALPHSLRLVIGHRLALVSKETSRVLGTAAVVGRSFNFSLLEATTHAEPDRLVDSLEEAERAGLISSRLEHPEARFKFAHELIRRAALDQISIARRQRLHLNIAEAMEQLYSDSLDEHAEDLAHHFWSAGSAADPAKAVRYLQSAGEKAVRSSAFAEARESYWQAIGLLKRLPESPERDLRELELVRSILPPLMFTAGFSAPESIHAVEHAAVLAEKSGSLKQLVDLMISQGFAYAASGNLEAAVTLADRALELALREGSPLSIGDAHTLQVYARYFRGDLAGVEKHFMAALKCFEDPDLMRQPIWAVTTFGVASWNAWTLGRADVAREREARMMGLKTNPYGTVAKTFFAASLRTRLREYDQAEALAARALELSEQHHFPWIATLARICVGNARARLGQVEEGMALIRRGIAELLDLGTTLALSGYIAFEAAALQRQGASFEALATVEQAIRQHHDQIIYRPDIFSLRGDLRLEQEEVDMAEADFREAIALSQKIDAKAYELRATMSLARLLGKQGRNDEARATLAAIYNWFTEGFDTADLKEAKALLDELST